MVPWLVGARYGRMTVSTDYLCSWLGAKWDCFESGTMPKTTVGGGGHLSLLITRDDPLTGRPQIRRYKDDLPHELPSSIGQSPVPGSGLVKSGLRHHSFATLVQSNLGKPAAARKTPKIKGNTATTVVADRDVKSPIQCKMWLIRFWTTECSMDSPSKMFHSSM